MSWRGGKVGEGTGKSPPRAPSTRWWGQRGNDGASAGEHRYGQPSGTGEQKGVPKSVAPRIPMRLGPLSHSVPYQSNFLPSGPKH